MFRAAVMNLPKCSNIFHYLFIPLTNAGYCFSNRHGFSGRYCEIQERFCLSKPCKNNSTCVEQLETYTCKCPRGFTGKQCHLDVNECASSPCLNGGSCSNLVGMYKCKCLDSYAGKHRKTIKIIFFAIGAL